MRFPATPLLAGLAAGALAVATPAQAQIFDDDDRDGDVDIGAEEVIAGAAVVGGLAAILGAFDGDDDDDYYDERYDGRYYGDERYRQQYTRELVERCVHAAENDARRFGPANVTRIEDVDRDGAYLQVEGDIRVSHRYARDRYGREIYDEADEGEFRCTVDRRGRIVNVRYDGLDRWGY